MTDSVLDQFVAPPSREARQELLFEAAGLVDDAGALLGGPGGAGPEDGGLLRDLAGDEVGLAQNPIVFRLDQSAFASQGLPIPATFEEITRTRRLYWLSAPISLFPARNWGFNALDVRLEFNSETQSPAPRPVTFRVLPDAEVETIADVGGGVDVSLNANLAFAAHTPKVDLTAAGIPLAAKAGADVSAVADTHAALGPFHYRLTKAKITHTPLGMEYVRWRIDGAEFFETDGPSLVVILAVPNDVTEVVIDAQMAARRYFRFAAAPLQEKIRRLPARLREFFVKDGAPVPDDTVWDITAQL